MEVASQSVIKKFQKILSPDRLLNATPSDGEQSKSGDFFYYQLMSPAQAEKLIRYWTEKGIKRNDIALFCSTDFLFKVELYSGGDVKAEVNPETTNYKIVISTKVEKYSKFPNHRKILLNLDDKIETGGFDEVYCYYTKAAKNKKKGKIKQYPLLAEVKDRDWKALFTACPEFYRRNYMCLTYNYFYSYIKHNPETVREDGLWLPNFTFTKWNNKLNEKVFELDVCLNRTLAYSMQIPNNKHLDFITTFDEREYNPIIMINSTVRETLIYQALTEKFSNYICFDIDFNSCFQNIILKAIDAMQPQQIIDFKQLTETGKHLTLEQVFEIGGKKMTDKSKEDFKADFEEGGSQKLAKSLINAVFNGFGKSKEHNPRKRIENTLKWLIDYDWNTVDFEKLDDLQWLNKESFHLAARIESHIREELQKYIRYNLPAVDFRFINMHDGILVFCPKEKAEALRNCLRNSLLCVNNPATIEYNDYSLQVAKGFLFPYKWNDNLPKKLEREEFIKTFDLQDNTQMEYNHKGKFAGKNKGKNKHQYGFDCPQSEKLNAGIYTMEEMKQINKRKQISTFAVRKCNCKKIKLAG